MNLGVFVYARTDSRRLPGKVLRPFGTSTLLEHVIARSFLVRAQHWVLLTSDRSIDDVLASLASRRGLAVVRGSASDLVARTLVAIDSFGLTHFVRVNADSPCFEPRLVNALTGRASHEEFASNLFERRFPYGVAVEYIDASCYRRLASTARRNELEHVTQHLYRQIDNVQALSLTQQADHSHLDLAVDTTEDYDRMRSLFSDPASHPEPYWELLNLQEPVLRWGSVPDDTDV